jgi:hypothetical protein
VEVRGSTPDPLHAIAVGADQVDDPVVEPGEREVEPEYDAPAA